MFDENAIIKDWRKIDISFGLIYPNIYKLGMSSYSIRLLYFLLNSNDKIACERFFLPEGKIKFPASKDYKSPNLLRSIENKVLPKEFDILGFSLHFENDFKNILWFLEKASIPLSSLERRESIIRGKNYYPIIIGGGPVATSNPIPLSKIFDFFFIGDSEPNLNLFLELFLSYKFKEINFQEFLKRARLIQGIFVPSLNNKTKRSTLKNLDEAPIPNFQLMSSSTNNGNIFENNFFVEINRGCPFKCKFCLSSFHNTPFRNRSYEKIIDSIKENLKYSNFNTISLIGSCVSSHPKFKKICDYIINQGKRLTIPSIRIEHLTSEVMCLLEKGGIKTITLAPETGSEKLRYELGKKISNDKIYSVLRDIKKTKIKNVKLYFLIGLPNENDEDINEIIILLKNISKIGFGPNSIRVNVNPFVPKLNTPYEKKIDFYLDKNFKTFKLKYQKLERELKNIASIKLKFKKTKLIVNNAKLQTLFSLGDKKVSDILLNYYLNGANFGSFRRAEKELNFSINDFLLKIKAGYRPWSF
ncbi:MAG: B12-binding domain-containing radical SAM protein [Promethearchaeota archaeon]